MTPFLDCNQQQPLLGGADDKTSCYWSSTPPRRTMVMVLIAAPYDLKVFETDIDTSKRERDENLSLFLLYIFFLSLERKNGDSKLSPILA